MAARWPDPPIAAGRKARALRVTMADARPSTAQQSGRLASVIPRLTLNLQLALGNYDSVKTAAASAVPVASDSLSARSFGVNGLLDRYQTARIVSLGELRHETCGSFCTICETRRG